MNVIDVNVLIALFDGGHAHHGVASEWWRETQGSGAPVTVPDVVWAGFLRIVTGRGALPVPASFEDAWAFAESLKSQPNYLSFVANPRTLEEFGSLAGSASARGDLVTDAYIAACAAAYGATVVTFDRDFRKFDEIKVHELETSR